MRDIQTSRKEERKEGEWEKQKREAKRGRKTLQKIKGFKQIMTIAGSSLLNLFKKRNYAQNPLISKNNNAQVISFIHVLGYTRFVHAFINMLIYFKAFI